MNVISSVVKTSTGVVGYLFGLVYSLAVTVALCFLAIYVGKSATTAVIFAFALVAIVSIPELARLVERMLPNLSGWFSASLVAVCYIASMIFEAM